MAMCVSGEVTGYSVMKAREPNRACSNIHNDSQ